MTLPALTDPATVTRADLPARHAAVEADLRAFVAAADEARLYSTYSYSNTRGDTFSWRVIDTLLHLVNHGTDHRAQLLATIHQLGHPTLEQDFVLFRREMDAARREN